MKTLFHVICFWLPLNSLPLLSDLTFQSHSYMVSVILLPHPSSQLGLQACGMCPYTLLQGFSAFASVGFAKRTLTPHLTLEEFLLGFLPLARMTKNWETQHGLPQAGVGGRCC